MTASPVLLAAATMLAQFCCLPPAVGADSGFYVGASGGVAVPDVEASTIDERLKALGFVSASTSTGEHATAYKVFVGYRLSRYFGVEAGYFDLGEFSSNSTVTPPGTLHSEITVRGGNFDLIASLPVWGEFSVYGRAGLQYARSEGTFSGSGSFVVANPNPSEDKASWKIGVGAEYRLRIGVGVRLEWERYRVDDSTGQMAGVDVFTAGAVLRF